MTGAIINLFKSLTVKTHLPTLTEVLQDKIKLITNTEESNTDEKFCPVHIFPAKFSKSEWHDEINFKWGTLAIILAAAIIRDSRFVELFLTPSLVSCIEFGIILGIRDPAKEIESRHYSTYYLATYIFHQFNNLFENFAQNQNLLDCFLNFFKYENDENLELSTGSLPYRGIYFSKTGSFSDDLLNSNLDKIKPGLQAIQIAMFDMLATSMAKLTPLIPELISIILNYHMDWPMKEKTNETEEVMNLYNFFQKASLELKPEPSFTKTASFQ